MATYPTIAGRPLEQTETRAAGSGITLWLGVPWFVWGAPLALLFAVFGMHYDASWHRSIGRDAFLTPAHQVMYFSGVISAVYAGYLLGATTFGKNAYLRRHSVTIWGLRAPLGVFCAAWGGLGALYDGVFDNWWHNAYGLDVRFVSPPHLLFSISLWFEMLGGLVLAASYLNQAKAQADGQTVNVGGAVGQRFDAVMLQRIVLFMGGMLLTAQLFACYSYTWDTKLHGPQAYVAMGLFAPIALAMIWHVARHRWACTIMAAIYSAVVILLILGMPLFPATPRLGPIYVPVTHMIPPRFPVLILVPCFALDLLWQRRKEAKGFIGMVGEALVNGAVFTGLLLAAEWPFADFLLSPASGNRFFGTRYLGFDDLTAPLTPAYWHFQVPMHPSAAHLAVGLTVAAVCASAGMLAGTALGNMVRLIRR